MEKEITGAHEIALQFSENVQPKRMMTQIVFKSITSSSHSLKEKESTMVASNPKPWLVPIFRRLADECVRNKKMKRRKKN